MQPSAVVAMLSKPEQGQNQTFNKVATEKETREVHICGYKNVNIGTGAVTSYITLLLNNNNDIYTI